MSNRNDGYGFGSPNSPTFPTNVRDQGELDREMQSFHDDQLFDFGAPPAAAGGNNNAVQNNVITNPAVLPPFGYRDPRTGTVNPRGAQPRNYFAARPNMARGAGQFAFNGGNVGSRFMLDSPAHGVRTRAVASHNQNNPTRNQLARVIIQMQTMSTQIAAMQTQMTDMQTQMANIRTCMAEVNQVAALRAQVDLMQTEVDAIAQRATAAQLEALRAQVANMQTQMDNRMGDLAGAAALPYNPNPAAQPLAAARGNANTVVNSGNAAAEDRDDDRNAEADGSKGTVASFVAEYTGLTLSRHPLCSSWRLCIRCYHAKEG